MEQSESAGFDRDGSAGQPPTALTYWYGFLTLIAGSSVSFDVASMRDQIGRVRPAFFGSTGMRRAARVRAVYFELRRALGSELPAIDLLRAAALIVSELLDEEADEHARTSGQAIPFHARALDEAFADGGWHVLAFECGQDYAAHAEADPGQVSSSRGDRWLIGKVQWPRPTEMA